MKHSLWPREHGAYAQLGVPLGAALLARTPTASAAFLAAGACFAFLANEPLVILLGHRGRRRQAELHDRAARRLGILAAATVVTGACGLVLASRQVLAVCALVAVPSLLMLAMSWRRSAHSVTGELIAALALPGASVPVAVASGAGWERAMLVWSAWSLGYASSVLVVHHVLSRRRAGRPVPLIAITCSAVALAVVVPTYAIAVPLALAAAVIMIQSPSPRQLRRIGVVLVVASVVSAALAVLSFSA